MSSEDSRLKRLKRIFRRGKKEEEANGNGAQQIEKAAAKKEAEVKAWEEAELAKVAKKSEERHRREEEAARKETERRAKEELRAREKAVEEERKRAERLREEEERSKEKALNEKKRLAKIEEAKSKAPVAISKEGRGDMKESGSETKPHIESKHHGLFGRGKSDEEKEPVREEVKPMPPPPRPTPAPKPAMLPQGQPIPQPVPQPSSNVSKPQTKETPAPSPSAPTSALSASKPEPQPKPLPAAHQGPPGSGPAPVQKVAQPQKQEKSEAQPKHPTAGGSVPLEPPVKEEDEDALLAQRFKFLKNVKVRFPFVGTQIPPSWKVLERYPVNSPFAYAVIAQSPLLSRRYYLDEVPLTKTEAAIYSYLLDALEAELTVPREQVNPRQYFADQARKILLKYSIRVPAASWSKIIYFAERDLVGFGVLDGMMRDPNIEDLSIDALSKPLFVYHKGYESLESNLTITDEEQMDNLITRLSHMAGKHVSTAYPIVQGTLPGRHRLIATFRKEVSPQGSTATIRKFREDPLTIIDMLNLNLMDFHIAAYTWYLMQNRATAVVVGSSVDYSTPIIYRQDGQVSVTETGKLIDPYFAKSEDGRVYTSGIEVFCFDPKTYETKWSPIQYVFRHRHLGMMLKFRLQTGREVTVTRDHSIFVLRNGKVEAVPANEIGLGDFVVASKSIQNETRETAKVDLLEELGPSAKGMFLYDVPREVFGRIEGINADERKDWKHARRMPLEYARLIHESEKAEVRLGYKGSSARLRQTIEVDEGLGRLLGYYLAEGAMKLKFGEEYTVYFTLGLKDKKMAQDIMELIESKFGTKATVMKHRGNSFRVVAHNRILVELLSRWIGPGAGRKEVPEIMFNSPSPVRRAFLRAWSVGDFGVTTSRRLMNGILYLLLMEKSLGTATFNESRGSVGIEGRRVSANDSYQMKFPRPEDVIASNEWRSTRKLREPNYPVSQVPADMRKMAYKRSKIFGNCSPNQRVTNRTMSLLRRRVSELIQYSGTPLKDESESTHDGFYRSNSKFYDHLDGRLQAGQALLDLSSRLAEVERITQSNLAFLKVVGLEEVESTSEFVYDVSVPECENFMAGFGGVFCHNTGAGKTTLLNALLTLTRLNTKMVTIEEVQEINIPHLNWTSLVSRESYAATEEKAGEVTLFELVKAAMRMRPDILCVGEVRGEEAYVLFQAISTGHGGIATLHADDTASALQRLVSAPMNVPPAFLPFLDLSFVVRRIAIPAPGGGFRAIRRVVAVDEVVAAEEVSRAFRWDPRTDTFKASYDKSPKLERVARDNGITMGDIVKEIDKRALVLRWIQQKGIRNFKELSPILELYVSRPEEVFKTASTELEAKGIAVAEIMGGFRQGA